jgi:hypothetical protein
MIRCGFQDVLQGLALERIGMDLLHAGSVAWTNQQQGIREGNHRMPKLKKS